MADIAFVFPGQGSQMVGMGAKLAHQYQAAAEIFERADDILEWSISDLCFHGPPERLNLTEHAQPALFVASMAAMAALLESGLKPALVCGHSLGEYSALAAARSLTFEDGLRLVARRGSIMAEASIRSPGSMAAVLGLEDSEVERICSSVGDVWPVNYNCPGQLVISGAIDAVAAAIDKFGAAGAKKVVRLAVSGAFHSPLMQPAADELAAVLNDTNFGEPAPPFVSSITGRPAAAADLPQLFALQMVSPVRWRQTIEKLISEGTGLFVEVGSGKVLSGLVRRIDGNVKTVSVQDPNGVEKALDAATLLQA